MTKIRTTKKQCETIVKTMKNNKKQYETYEKNINNYETQYMEKYGKH